MRAGGRARGGGGAALGAWCVPCGANTGEAETVVVRTVRRNAVVMKAVSQRMDRVRAGFGARGRWPGALPRWRAPGYG